MELDNCILCNKNRWDKNNRPIWNTGISIFDIKTKISVHWITVCPNCRKRPFNDIIIEMLNKQSKDILKKTKHGKRN